VLTGFRGALLTGPYPDGACADSEQGPVADVPGSPPR